ncbi:MAG: hypothetical protein AB8G77_18720 [Rhodothermales bacterium]
MLTENLIKEEILPYFGFRGHVHLFEGPSTDDYPAAAPVDIIQTDQSFHVRFHWRTTGNLNYIMCGKWKCQIYLEKMGGDEFTLNPAHAIGTEEFVAQPKNYNCKIDVPALQVKPGVYRLVATLTLIGDTGVPAPVAAFADLGLIQFYSDGPAS